MRKLQKNKRRIFRHDITGHVAAEYSSENCIRLLNYNTRDNITIHKGDRKW